MAISSRDDTGLNGPTSSSFDNTGYCTRRIACVFFFYYYSKRPSLFRAVFPFSIHLFIPELASRSRCHQPCYHRTPFSRTVVSSTNLFVFDRVRSRVFPFEELFQKVASARRSFSGAGAHFLFQELFEKVASCR